MPAMPANPTNIQDSKIKDKIIQAWGVDAYVNIQEALARCTQKWGLSQVQFFEHYSMNGIFFCHGKNHGPCVLKISAGQQVQEFLWEYHILNAYHLNGSLAHGPHYVKLYAGDMAPTQGAKAMLLEKITPGTQLMTQPLKKRLSVFAHLLTHLHIQAPASLVKSQGIPHYTQGFADYLQRIPTTPALAAFKPHLLAGQDICQGITALYPQEMLLHGDLQFHNIIQRADGTYALIDPQGRVGAWVFDIARYILVEFYNAPAPQRQALVAHIICQLAGQLQVSKAIIGQCFYAEMVLFESWRATTGDYDVDNVVFAQGFAQERRPVT